MTQFGRALSELNIEILCANTSQAKGRVERASYAAGSSREGVEARVHQHDRGSQRLPAQLRSQLQRPLCQARGTRSGLSSCRRSSQDLDQILCWREQRQVSPTGGELQSYEADAKAGRLSGSPSWQDVQGLRLSGWQARGPLERQVVALLGF